MSEPYIHSRENLPPTESRPIFIFHGDVHGFTYSANPQGDLVSCMMINPATSTSPSRSESLRQNTARAQSSGSASQTRNFPSESSNPTVYIPPPLSSSLEGNQDAESITSFHTTPTVYYDCESGVGSEAEGASITSNRGAPIDESKEFLRFLIDIYRRGLLRWFFQLGRQNAPGLFFLLEYRIIVENCRGSFASA